MKITQNISFVFLYLSDFIHFPLWVFDFTRHYEKWDFYGAKWTTVSVLKKMKFQMQICIISPVFSPRISSPNSSFTLVLCCLTDFLIVFRFALMRLYARKCSIENNGEWRDRAICEVCVGLYYFFTLKSRESMQVLEDAFLRSTQNFQSSSEIAQKKCRIVHEIY